MFDLGETVYQLIVGGEMIGPATLLRFYVWHIVGLIVPMIFLLAWHAFRVRRDGGISHRERLDHQPEAPRLDREQLVRVETIAFFLTLATLIVLATFVNAPLGNPPDQSLSADKIPAPWIFLWVQELLRIWPPAIAGVLVPALVTALLVALPFIDRKDDGIAVWFNRQGRLAQLLFIVVAVAVVGLTIRAALR
jgi:quinol-cytochrome oxidoreductase complex cytochrome b subunit